ncbi:MAG: sigma 54-interacting transcriptional regulator [Lachnospiraceae bacterium]|nr:sigma 54-interacting transcriptional regulator [Lachnospiraceae bacterium]
MNYFLNEESELSSNMWQGDNDPEYFHDLINWGFSKLEGVMMLDEKQRYVYISDDYAKMMEVNIPSALGKRIDEVIDNTDIPMVIEGGKDLREALYTRHGKSFVVNRFLWQENGKFKGIVAQSVLTSGHTEPQMLEHTYMQMINYYKEKYEQTTVAQYDINSIVSKSTQMEDMKNNIRIIAPTRSSVLVTGETGTGKELAAAALHNLSGRAGKPFIKLNCASIPESLMESELFGYVGGSFTGALKGGKIGDFEAANGGTIFLDEVDSLSLNMQAKLLRSIQEKEIKKVGSSEPIPIDVRFIFATNKDLYQLVKEEKFREDFYYRINVVNLHLPPLRERKEDILPLAENFIKKFNLESGRNIIGLAPASIDMLENYDWPGNIRELENCIERAFAYCRGNFILPGDIKLNDGTVSCAQEESFNAFSLKEIRERAEKTAIERVLKHCGGNKAETASLLKIDRSILYDKLKKYNISY